MRTRTRIGGVAVAVILTMSLLGTPPADAESVGAPLQFTGTANLPTFPCSQFQQLCNGTFDGTVEGVIGGQNFEVWAAELRAAELTATFSYHDANCTDGTAEGDAVIDAGLGDVIGFWRMTQDTAEETLTEAPVPIVGLRAQIHFDWDREATQATLRLLDVDVQLELPLGALPAGETVIEVVLDGGGEASAVFAPIFFDGTKMWPRLPDCTGSGAQVEVNALVSGTAAIADTN